MESNPIKFSKNLFNPPLNVSDEKEKSVSDKKEKLIFYVRNNKVRVTTDTTKAATLSKKEKDLKTVANKVNEALTNTNLSKEDAHNLTSNLHQLQTKIDQHNRKVDTSKILKFLSKVNIFERLFSIKSFFYVNDLSITKITPGSFELLEPEKGNQILAKTEMPHHDGAITRERIEELGLQPKYSTTIHNREIYFSPIFYEKKFNENTGQVYAIAYVKNKKNDLFKPTLIYLSGTQNLWRVAPNYIIDKDRKLHFDKGYQDGKSNKPIENSVNLPFLEIAVPLNEMIAKNTVIDLEIEGDTEELINGLLTSRKVDEPSAFQEQLESVPVSPFQAIGTIPCVIDDFSVPTPNTIEWKSKLEEDHPDFNLAREFFLPGTLCSDGKVIVVPSKNMNWRYIFYMNKAESVSSGWREREEHPTLASVEWIGEGQDLTDFGTFSIVSDPKGADMPFIEYRDQTPIETCRSYAGSKDELENLEGKPYPIRAFRENKEAVNEIVDIGFIHWPTWKGYREHIPILQEFQSWYENRG